MGHAPAPSFRARAPGRVNLIGEHVDYHDLPVLPMALERGVEIRFTPRSDGVIRIANEDPSFEPVSLPVSAAPEPGPDGHWGNYVRAAVATVAALEVPGGLGGLDGVVYSNLPRAAGLSSSSALLVATALALLQTRRDLEWTPPAPTALAELLARGERYVGTAGGGMDQAASLGGRSGRVLRIRFDPVEWETRALPDGWAVIVAHSGVRAEKSGPARAAYNALRGRGEAARDVLARGFGTAPDWRVLCSAVDPETLREAARRLPDADAVAAALHVLEEAERVEAAWEALGRADIETFGGAMDRSHDSLTNRCGVGHPRLDALVATAREAGAAGARLTGAGFGGCIVAVVEEARADAVLEALRRGNADSGLQASDAPVFRARPGPGAGVERRS